MDTLLGATLYRNLVERNAAAEAALRGCLAAHRDDVLWAQFKREVRLNLSRGFSLSVDLFLTYILDSMYYELHHIKI